MRESLQQNEIKAGDFCNRCSVVTISARSWLLLTAFWTSRCNLYFVVTISARSWLLLATCILDRSRCNLSQMFSGYYRPDYSVHCGLADYTGNILWHECFVLGWHTACATVIKQDGHATAIGTSCVGANNTSHERHRWCCKEESLATRQNCEGMGMIMQQCNKPVGRCAFHCSLLFSQRLNMLLYTLNKKSLMKSTQPYVFSQTLLRSVSYFNGIVA